MVLAQDTNPGNREVLTALNQLAVLAVALFAVLLAA
jgi:hypothetical protein